MLAMSQGCEVLYSDTDSIHLDKPLKPGPYLGDELGKLKLENENCKAIYLTAKAYVIKSNKDIVVRLKGLPTSSSSKLTYEDFERFLSGEELKVEYTNKNILKDMSNLTIKTADTKFDTKFDLKRRNKVYSNNV